MTKTEVLYLILNFGKLEERNFRMKGQTDEAYQIEYARNEMNKALLKSIKNLKNLIPKMYEYTIDEEGYWHYDVWNFTRDELTRQLLKDFYEKNFE